jgi:RNA polymerase sigma factor (sigma-70 family)
MIEKALQWHLYNDGHGKERLKLNKGLVYSTVSEFRSLEDDVKDDDLIERAKQNDPDAFGELVRRHRAKAYGWAKKMTQDPYLAEDIVQDALLNAFLQISTLIDSSKFMAWFHRIVANQGYMKLRRGGYFGKEHTFTSLSTHQTNHFDWSNIDHVLFHLSETVKKNPSPNPMDQLIRKETIDGIKTMLSCLTEKERSIFESYFFEQLNPKEIASLFQTKVSNVYNLLSRSKAKIQTERIRICITEHVSTRAQNGLPRRRALDPSKIL